MYQVPVFISHSWCYSDHYDTLADWIFGDSWSTNGTPIQFQDVSVPKDNPIHYAPNEAALRAAKDKGAFTFGPSTLEQVIPALIFVGTAVYGLVWLVHRLCGR